MLNRYLDICDLIDDPSSDDAIDPEEFLCSDVPSLKDLRIPENNFIPEDKRSDLKNRVLKISMDRQEEARLPCKSCPKCSKEVFEVK